jgi:tRNA (mo5U34)-methyltransferase
MGATVGTEGSITRQPGATAVIRSPEFGDDDRVRAEIAGVNWYHRIDLGGGIVTPGVDQTESRLRPLRIPEDLSGKTVLDIGAWDGFFSFEAERRGANRVLATDSYSWGGGGWGTKDGFETARRILGSSVEELQIDVMDLSPDRVGTFDVVLFIGVLYHLRHPFLALERVASVTEGLLILDTHTALVRQRRPMMLFYPTNELNDDHTNWWGPNPAAVEAMLRDVGFTRVEQPAPKLTRRGRLIVHAAK